MSKLVDLSWYDFHSKVADFDFAILPIGSVEQHGKHLPLGTDTMVASGFAERLAKLSNALVLPAIPYGVMLKYDDWPGSFSVDFEIFQRLLINIAEQIVKNKLKKRLLIISGHDENKEATIASAQKISSKYDIDIIVVEWAHVALADLEKLMASENEVHGGEILTSLMLHWHPDLVFKDAIEDTAIKKSALVDDFHGLRNVYRPYKMHFDANGENGVQGYPSFANKALGEKIEKVVLENIQAVLTKASW